MTNLPEHDEQIRLAHAELINLVASVCLSGDNKSQLDSALRIAKSSGWDSLVNRIQRIVNGDRDQALLNGLDDEDTVIVRSILRGIQNPARLPDPSKNANPAMAAPGLAHLIHAASSGNIEALQYLSFMAEQMVQTQGDLRQLGGIMRLFVNGERNPDILCKGMSGSGEQLVLNILDELSRLNLQ